MEIIKDIRNDLLKRHEVSLSLEAEKNPNFDEMKKQVAEKFKKSGENIDVYNIKGSFGSSEFKIDAYIYDSKEDLEKARPKKKKKEEKKTEEAKSEGEKTEEKDEKPVEGGAPAEDKPEQVEEEPKEKPTEAPVEERPEQEEKAVEEQRQVEEEAKEP